MSSLPDLSAESHAQPLPKRPIAAFVNSSLNLAKSPNTERTASASAPDGSPPLPLASVSQKSEWLAWPPPLLRTTVRIPSGTFSRSAISFSTGRAARSACASSALLTLVT